MSLNMPKFTDKIAQNVSMRAWHSSGVGDLNTGVQRHAGYGEQAYMMSCGGENTVGRTAETEEFNGTIWSTAGAADLNTAVKSHAAGGGSATSGLSFGGESAAVTGETEKWNGSVWSVASVGDLITAVSRHAGCNGAGSTHQYLSFGGRESGNATTETEQYLVPANAWSVVGVGDLNTAVQVHGGSHDNFGSAGGAFTISFGGTSSLNVTTVETEQYAGSWTVSGIGDMIFSVYEAGSAGHGSNALAVGYDRPMQEYRRFDTNHGFWWTTGAYLNTKAYYNEAHGDGEGALSWGGYNKTIETEEYN